MSGDKTVAAIPATDRIALHAQQCRISEDVNKMAIENNNRETGQDLPPAHADGAQQLSPAGAARRRLARIGGSGVLMTLASQGAMAALVCKSPSGSLSGNLTSNAPAAVSCSGVSPGYWKNHPSAWSDTGVKCGDHFKDYFYTAGAAGYCDVRCMDILDHQDYDTCNIGMHIMATYLNVTSGMISFMKPETVTSMWREYITTNQYVPAAGAKPWNAADIVLYLQSTQS